MFSQGADQERRGDWFGALNTYAHILKLDKRNTKALTLSGLIAMRLNRQDDALASFEKALKINPADADLLNNLAVYWLQQNRPDKAETYALRSYKVRNNSLETLKALFKIYYYLGKVKKAQQFIQQAIALQPDNAEFKLDLAQCYDSGGDPDKAKLLFQELLAANVHQVHVYDGLVRLQKFQEEPALYQQIQERINHPSTSPQDKPWLYRALGKIDDDLGRYDEALANFQKAKNPQRAQLQASSFKSHIQLLKQVIDEKFFRERSGWGLPSNRPIFVFGMPRSGTTLVEQILAAHPAIYGANEPSYFRDVARTIVPVTDNVATLLSALQAQKRTHLQSIAQDYLKLMVAYSADAERVVNKMPHNFEVLWLLVLAFPKASFIHCRRSAMATCVSCFTQPLGEQHAYAEDLASLGEYYRSYVDLMDHWRKVLPVKMLELDYEQLVINQETESRRLIDHVGLEWDEACLQFHQIKRGVRTPSRRQVEQPIYTQALEGWRRYEKHLAPLIAALDDLAQN